MNNLLKTVKNPDSNPIDFQTYTLDLLHQKDYWLVNEILPLIFQQKHINPFADQEMQNRRISPEKPSNEAIEELAKHLETLIRDRKCKLEGVCEIRNELYMEAFNELIRQITIDCPERGLFLANIRDEIGYSLSAFEELYDNGMSFNSRRQVSADQDADILNSRKGELQQKLNTLHNERINLSKELANLHAKQAEVEIKDIAEKDQEIEFLKTQNQNLENFLQHVKTLKDPIEIKNSFEKK